MPETSVQFLVRKIPWRRGRLPTPVFWDFPCVSGPIPGLERSPGERNWLPTPVFWPGEFNGLYSPWGHKELDTTEQLSPLWPNFEDQGIDISRIQQSQDSFLL